MAKIYLSATYRDLKPHRDAVHRILRMLRHDVLRHDVIAMEDYVATDVHPLDKCLADVAASDLYVGLVGWRYGYVPDQVKPERKSITELEYRQAHASGLPKRMFLADEEAPWPDDLRDSRAGDNENGKRIADFRAELENAKLVTYFRTPDHLAGLVSVAVQRCSEGLSTAKERPGSRIRQVRRQALGKRLDSLLADYQAATEQLAYTLGAVDRNRLDRQAKTIWEEIDAVERALAEPLPEASEQRPPPTSGSDEVGDAAIPKSQCRDPAVQALADQLHDAYGEQERLLSEGAGAAEPPAVLNRIVELKRRIREGGRLRAGDFLLDGHYKLLESLKQGGFSTIFGAFDTRTGALGTFGYAAPEAMRQAKDADARADVHGLGMTAIFALRGADPDLFDVLRDPDGFVDRLPISHSVKPVLARAVAWKAADRYESMKGFCPALGQARVRAENGFARSLITADGDSTTPPEARPAESSDRRSDSEDAVRSAPLCLQAGTGTRGRRLASRTQVAPSIPTPFQDPFKDVAGNGPAMMWPPGGTFRMGSQPVPNRALVGSSAAARGSTSPAPVSPPPATFGPAATATTASASASQGRYDSTLLPSYLFE